MEKQSVDLLNLALLSLLTGAGTYAGGRGLHDLANKNTHKEEDPSTLNITLPEARMPKHASASVEDYLMPALTGALGLGGGFFGASNIYENYKKKQLNKQLSDVEKNYLKALQEAHQKTAEAKTPNVDKFIAGMLAKIGEAVEKCPAIIDLMKKGNEKVAWESPDFMGSEGITDSLVHQAQNAKDSFFNTELGKATAAAMLLTGMGGAGLTFSTMRHMDNKDDDIKKKTTLPTDIRLHVSK